MKSGLAGLFAAAVMASPAAAPAQTYNVTDLGAVSGQKVSKAYGLNALGQAAGSSSNPSGAIATLFSNGKAINLGTLEPLDVAIATALNSAGQVVGNSYATGGQQGGFLYANGKVTFLGVPSGASATSAVAINSTGQIAGAIYLSTGGSHAALYSNGVWTDLGGIAGAAGTSATGINTALHIVGIAIFPVTSCVEAVEVYQPQQVPPSTQPNRQRLACPNDHGPLE